MKPGWTSGHQRILLLALAMLAAACSSAEERAPALEASGSSPEGGAGGALSFPISCETDARPDAIQFDAIVSGFAARDDATPPPDAPVVFTGSSSIERWTTLEQDMDPHPVVNNGISGSRISDTLAHFESTILPYEPSGVVFYAGENDLNDGLSPACVLEDFQTLVTLLRQSDMAAPIFFVSMKPSPARAHLQAQMDQGNDYIESFAEETVGVDFIDIVEPILDASGAARGELFSGDQLHMNEAGYEIWAAEIKPYLDAL